MRKYLALALIAPTLALADCRTYTVEQERLLKLAADYGRLYGYEQTLPAIVEQESFLGSKVERRNINDGQYGSYGITHITLETAAYLEGFKLNSREMITAAISLVNNDIYALKLAVKKLDSYKGDTWFGRWKSYNGSGKQAEKYAVNISDIISNHKHCGIVKNSFE